MSERRNRRECALSGRVWGMAGRIFSHDRGGGDDTYPTTPNNPAIFNTNTFLETTGSLHIGVVKVKVSKSLGDLERHR
jgi:hypothetical protein